MKILKYEKIKYELTDSEAEQVVEFLEQKSKPTHFTFRGQSLKASKMEVLDSDMGDNYSPAFMDYHWEKDELLKWEKDIYARCKSFEEYMIIEGAWIVDEMYPDGAVRNPKKYRELQAKWNALQLIKPRITPAHLDILKAQIKSFKNKNIITKETITK